MSHARSIAAANRDAFNISGNETTPVDRFGSGGDDGEMEARIARLEATTECIQRGAADIKADVREIKRDQRMDFRLTWTAIIATTLGLAGLLAKGFGWLS